MNLLFAYSIHLRLALFLGKKQSIELLCKSMTSVFYNDKTRLNSLNWVKPKLAFLHSLKRSETLIVFSDVFSGYKHGTLRRNGLMSPNFASKIKWIWAN